MRTRGFRRLTKQGKWNGRGENEIKFKKQIGKSLTEILFCVCKPDSFREGYGKVWPKKSENYLRHLIFVMLHKLEDIQLKFLRSAGKKKSGDYCKLNLILHSIDNNVLQ